MLLAYNLRSSISLQEKPTKNFYERVMETFLRIDQKHSPPSALLDNNFTQQENEVKGITAKYHIYVPPENNEKSCRMNILHQYLLQNNEKSCRMGGTYMWYFAVVGNCAFAFTYFLRLVSAISVVHYLNPPEFTVE